MADKYPVVSATDEERTTVDPGALDQWQDERTVADPPSTATTDVVPDNGEAGDFGDFGATPKVSDVVLVNRPAVGSESENETIDELTIEERKAALRPPPRSGGSPTKLPKATLVVRTGPHEGETFTLTKTTMTVGRALSNDIVLVDPSISKRHLKIEYDGLSFFLQDLGSGNGTIVNGRDEDNRYRLINRDAVELGRSIITFECAAMNSKAPTISPPKPRPSAQGKGRSAPPPPRPTASLRGTNKHPEFVQDVDDDASTIAGQRPPGPALRSNKPPPSGRVSKAPNDLVMPRDPRPKASPRMTLPSPAVPAPKNPRKRAQSSLPTKARSAEPRPVLLEDDEEPTTAASPPRRPVVAPRAPSPRPQSMSSPSLPRARSTSVPPQRRPQPTSVPPSAAAVVYPTAPVQFNRSGAAMALSPRAPAAAGVMEPVGREPNRTLIYGIALVAVAAVVGVTVAAIAGGGGDKKAVAPPTEGSGSSSEVAAGDPPDEPAKPAAVVDAGMKVTALEPDAAQATPDEPKPVDVTLGRELLGNDETILASIPEIKTLEPNPDAPIEDPDAKKKAEEEAKKKAEEEAKKKAEEEARRKEDAARLADDDEPKNDKAFVRKTKGRALAAYRDRNFARAASLYKSAAAKASKREARSLRTKASRLLKLQSLLSGAKNSGAIAAFVAYNEAKRVDRGLGKKHQTFINAQLLRVGPDAAKLYMAKKNYSKAARAVTISRSVGDRKRTARIMASLEDKARVKIAAGKAAAKRGNTKKAKSEFTAAKAMLPAQSELASEVRELLNDL